ncbi:hypothetical protein [Kitasatospora sp. NPDC050543]|uniref:hypothetical protein n=1 Tax=Kitasatospora sp. NPDC050543 TaxID=3364054 RepID=UPI00378A9491
MTPIVDPDSTPTTRQGWLDRADQHYIATLDPATSIDQIRLAEYCLARTSHAPA